MRDRDDSGYVALKIYITGYIPGNKGATYERINSVFAGTKHAGHQVIRKFFSSLTVAGPHGKHTCIVHEALGITMERVLDYLPNRSLRVKEARQFLRQLLIGLDFLHTHAGVIHTGKSDPITRTEAARF